MPVTAAANSSSDCPPHPIRGQLHGVPVCQGPPQAVLKRRRCAGPPQAGGAPRGPPPLTQRCDVTRSGRRVRGLTEVFQSNCAVVSRLPPDRSGSTLPFATNQLLANATSCRADANLSLYSATENFRRSIVSARSAPGSMSTAAVSRSETSFMKRVATNSPEPAPTR